MERLLYWNYKNQVPPEKSFVLDQKLDITISQYLIKNPSVRKISENETPAKKIHVRGNSILLKFAYPSNLLKNCFEIS